MIWIFFCFRLLEHVVKHKEDFARVAPYLIADVMDCFQRFTLYPEVRSNIVFGVHKLFNVCDNHSVDYLLGVLPSGKKEMFKHVFSNYTRYHKYSGKV